MLKKELRLNYLHARGRLGLTDVNSYSKSIANLALQIPIWQLEYYHIFLPIEDKNEVNTYLIIDSLRERNKKVVIPKIANEIHLEHFLLEQDTVLKKNRWGIPEPESAEQVPEKKIDLVFLPLLVFDESGHRVGYGKGYYDRFLKSCRSDVIKIGLSFFEGVEKISDTGPDDVRLDYCITPSTIYEF